MASVDSRRRHRSRSPRRDRERNQERDRGGRSRENRYEREDHRGERRRDQRDERDNSGKRTRPEHHNTERRDEGMRRRDDRQRDRGGRSSDNRHTRQDRESHRKHTGDRNPGGNDWGNQFGEEAGGSGEPPDEANSKDQGPNYELSGKLAEYTNTYKGVVIKYNEPPEARKPKRRWRLYPFKGQEAMSVMYVHRQSAYLMGRQRHIADIPIDHPSCSKQHAALQYRLVDYERPDGTMGRAVRPYIIDLESSNGTYLNNQRIEPRRYYELKEKDVLKFGFSTREYVLLHEHSEGVADEGSPAGSPAGSPE